MTRFLVESESVGGPKRTSDICELALSNDFSGGLKSHNFNLMNCLANLSKMFLIIIQNDQFLLLSS